MIPPHPLTTFKIQKYYQNEPRLNGVYFTNGEYVINFDENYDIGTHWIALYNSNNNVTYFGVEHISKETKKLIEYKQMIQ